MSTANPACELPHGMYSVGEERANQVTHGVGFILSVIGAGYLLSCAARSTYGLLLTCIIYVLSLMAVYAMSTLSHTRFENRWRNFFRSLDQGCIYFLIVGSAGPWAVAFLPATVCWALLGTMWAIAISGFLAKVCFGHRVDSVAVWIYVFLGWLPILSVPWLVHSAPATTLWLGLICGLCYTFGTIFLIFDRSVRHFHAVWHLFVMAGSAVHFFATLSFVA